MNETKPFWQSKGVWGAALAVASAVVAATTPYTVGDPEQAEAVELIAQVGAGVFGLLALWGRIKATKSLTK